jgi:excisionase family DNA binding protein
MQSSPNTDREGLTISDAASILGVGRSTIYKMIKDRRLTARKLGARTIILRTDLMAFLAALPAAA